MKTAQDSVNPFAFLDCPRKLWFSLESMEAVSRILKVSPDKLDGYLKQNADRFETVKVLAWGAMINQDPALSFKAAADFIERFYPDQASKLRLTEAVRTAVAVYRIELEWAKEIIGGQRA